MYRLHTDTTDIFDDWSVWFFFQRGLKAVYQKKLNAPTPIVIGGAGKSFCFCGVAKDTYRRSNLPNMQCPNCLVYWCCINDCEQEFYYVVDLLRHQFIGHLQSASILNLACSNCQAPKLRRTNFRAQSFTCLSCLKDMCALDGCPCSFNSVHKKRHFLIHRDPYTCKCGAPKLRNLRYGVCPNCNSHQCLFGHCTTETTTLRGMKDHQRKCQFN